mmetsp:Transcript_6517/g.9038  ORF Transcript_6517/g.9038 Transcript_6517/m.9038 type:complete len:336 (-) Transcript_6517:48-1055(-)
MDCPICFSDFDDNNHLPLLSFCCKKALCISCVKSIIGVSSSSCCPWDKRRWIGRSVLKNFFQSTPPNYIETLRQNEKNKLCNDNAVDEIYRYTKISQLGSGELKKDYEIVRQREEQRFQQEQQDELLAALKIAESLEAQSLEEQRQKEVAELEDFNFAQKLSNELQQEINLRHQTKTLESYGSKDRRVSNHKTIRFSFTPIKSSSASSPNLSCDSQESMICNLIESPKSIPSNTISMGSINNKRSLSPSQLRPHLISSSKRSSSSGNKPKNNSNKQGDLLHHFQITHSSSSSVSPTTNSNIHPLEDSAMDQRECSQCTFLNHPLLCDAALDNGTT